MKSVLVVFGKSLPKKSKKWFEQFDRILGPEELEKIIKSGSVHRAFELVNKLPDLTLVDGKKISKTVNYHGYELWWMDYDTIYLQFCFPYTQYADLLSYLKDFQKVYLFQPPLPQLFQYFLQAHDRQCFILNPFKLRRLLPIPFGIFIQAVLSVIFLPWLKMRRPKVMFWINDKLNYPYDSDFRKKLMYGELRERKILFAEFVRGAEPWHVVLENAFRRKRPVFYATAVINFIYSFARYFGENKKEEFTFSTTQLNPEDYFWRLVSVHYLREIRGAIWSILAIKFILRWLGVRSAIVLSGGNRTVHTILACKLAGIPTVGIQHGAMPKCYFVSDFMPGFDGEKQLSPDKYGLWSEWWRGYYLKYSRAFKPEQLFISGSPRPFLGKEIVSASPPASKSALRILFISEQMAEPKEVMPYLLTVLGDKDLIVSLKFRPQIDGFEEWLKKKEPDILKKVKTFKGDIHEAIFESDVVVGSYSTAVLEGLTGLKPIVFFKTEKWGDYFEVKSLNSDGCCFAQNPEELLVCIKKSFRISPEELKQLRERFFGDPHRNGSKWVVETAERLAEPDLI